MGSFDKFPTINFRDVNCRHLSIRRRYPRLPRHTPHLCMFWFLYNVKILVLMCESRSVETGGSGGCRAEMVWCYDFMMISLCSHTSNNLMHATHLPSDMLARSDDVWQCYRTSLNRKYILWVLYQTLSNTAYMSYVFRIGLERGENQTTILFPPPFKWVLLDVCY